ncbi:MAG: IS200/IS605 family element transposase accessory protein TnpB [Candidatus Aenigmarchaeota archaeon]|nr:IS200/IS605 family element transposase accessory protein TnpB [Candidatus Aenigmarchaeota archaeon]
MILTFKVKHNRDFSSELRKAKQIAEVAVRTRTQTTKDVKQYGLKSIIANQILRKYARNRRIKEVKNVNLVVPNTGISLTQNTIKVPSIKLVLKYHFPSTFEKINQIEFDEEFAYVSVFLKEPKLIETQKFIGVDLNTTGHIAVVGNPETGKVVKLGKEALHIHKKYKAVRMTSQRNGRFGILKRIRNRENRKIKDLNHKISRKIVDVAKEKGCGIKLEKLKGIRNNRKHRRSFNFALHSWSFRQLQSFIEYKAKLCGIPIVYVEPRHTSQDCSRCGNIGTRNGKEFVCQSCGHFDNADSNASFNIAKREGICQLNKDRDLFKGSTDTPRGATLLTRETPNLQTK